MAASATIRDLASHFNISVSTARKWVRTGVVPDDTYIKVHGTYRFDLERVDRAMLPPDDNMTEESDDE